MRHIGYASNVGAPLLYAGFARLLQIKDFVIGNGWTVPRGKKRYFMPS